ncbi:MAG TPA: glycosyltransferase 87 family protein [Candidatus Limnocylindrales bacterium]|jgi:hypothetical protein
MTMAIPARAAGWAACLVLLAWVMWAPIVPIGGLPGHPAWLVIVAGAGLGSLIGARTGALPGFVVLGASAIGAALLGYATLHGLINLRLVSRADTGGDVLSLVGAAAVLAGAVVGRRRRAAMRPAELLVVGAVTCFVLLDVALVGAQPMRDLDLDLLAGARFLHGQPPYLTAVVTSVPADEAQLPFLYPPFTLPFFGILSVLPGGLVIAGWLGLSIAGSIAALRWLGVRPAWIAVLLLWPPLFEGIDIGNVAVLTFALFVAAPRRPALLPAMAVFKVQSAIPSLWLIRERRWSGLLVGGLIVGGLAAITLPFVGLTAWADWLHGLQLYQASQALVPVLYGLALPRYMPYAAYVLLAVAAVAIATILGRGTAGLARLGIASVVASPSLYRHGLLVALPGLLGTGELVCWLGLAITANGLAIGWWLMVAAAAAGTALFDARRASTGPTVHPLGAGASPWPSGTAGAGRPGAGPAIS